MFYINDKRIIYFTPIEFDIFFIRYYTKNYSMKKVKRVDLEEKRLYIKLAYGYYQDKEYKKAAELYERLRKGEPGDFNILNMLGDTYLKLGKKENALDAYSDALASLEQKGQNLKIVKSCKKVLKVFSDESRIKARLKTALRNLIRDAERKAMNKQFGEARSTYEDIENFNSEEFPIAEKLKQLNEEEARHLEHTRKMHARQSGKKEDSQQGIIEKFDKMAQNYLNNGDYDGAVETYITALKLAPNNSELRAKLHRVYMEVAQQSAGEKVWEKIDSAPKAGVEEAKEKAIEEKHAQIIKEEEERARRLISEEHKFQREYEEKEMKIIQKAADELKSKLDEAQKKEKLKEEEIQRIMREQEQKKRALLEKVKREAVEKWKRQKAQIQKKMKEEEGKPPPPAEKAENPPPGAAEKPGLMDHLKKTYEKPELGAKPREQNKEKGPAPGPPGPAAEKKEKLKDDTGEAEKPDMKDDIDVNDDTLDSLFTTAFIYVNQGLIKEALRIYNKITEKYPEHPEAKQLIQEITKKQQSK